MTQRPRSSASTRRAAQKVSGVKEAADRQPQEASAPVVPRATAASGNAGDVDNRPIGTEAVARAIEKWRAAKDQIAPQEREARAENIKRTAKGLTIEEARDLIGTAVDNVVRGQVLEQIAEMPDDKRPTCIAELKKQAELHRATINAHTPERQAFVNAVERLPLIDAAWACEVASFVWAGTFESMHRDSYEERGHGAHQAQP